MDRRTVLKFVGVGVLQSRVQTAQSQLLEISEDPSKYRLQFFNSDEGELLDCLAEMIIPADDHSPGAHESKVHTFIDLIVYHSDQSTQQTWRTGLRAVQQAAVKRFKYPFVKCTPQQREQIMDTMAANEKEPTSELELFFVRLKSLTIDGYYTSAIGIHEDLQYQGNEPQMKFLGCTHHDH